MDTIMSIKLIELASYTTPAIVEQKNKEWVEYGEDNNYYQYLIDLYYGSPTNNAAIKGISDLIYGEGLEVVKADRHLAGYLDLKKVFHEDCLRNCAMDLKMLGQYAIHLVKSKTAKNTLLLTIGPSKRYDLKSVMKMGKLRVSILPPIGVN
jgi:hypothetical protein